MAVAVVVLVLGVLFAVLLQTQNAPDFSEQRNENSTAVLVEKLVSLFWELYQGKVTYVPVRVSSSYSV